MSVSAPEQTWHEDALRGYNEQHYALHGDWLDGLQTPLLLHWIEDRVMGREGEAPFWFVAEWNKEPWLVLLDPSGVRLAHVEGQEVETRYLPPLKQGKYVERWRNEGERFVLVMEFTHPSLPGVLGWEFRTIRVIDQENITQLRGLLYEWATAE